MPPVAEEEPGAIQAERVAVTNAPAPSRERSFHQNRNDFHRSWMNPRRGQILRRYSMVVRRSALEQVFRP